MHNSQVFGCWKDAICPKHPTKSHASPLASVSQNLATMKPWPKHAQTIKIDGDCVDTQPCPTHSIISFCQIPINCFCSNTSHGLWKSNFICERYIEQWMSLALHQLPNIDRRQGHDCAVALHIHQTNVKHSRWQSAKNLLGLTTNKSTALFHPAFWKGHFIWTNNKEYMIKIRKI